MMCSLPLAMMLSASGQMMYSPVARNDVVSFGHKYKKASLSTCFFGSGSDLLSRAASHQVPSALQSLTTVFGMGTGVTSASLSPNMLF